MTTIARPASRSPIDLMDFQISDSGDFNGIYVYKIHDLCNDFTQPSVFNLHGQVRVFEMTFSGGSLYPVIHAG